MLLPIFFESREKTARFGAETPLKITRTVAEIPPNQAKYVAEYKKKNTRNLLPHIPKKITRYISMTIPTKITRNLLPNASGVPTNTRAAQSQSQSQSHLGTHRRPSCSRALGDLGSRTVSRRPSTRRLWRSTWRLPSPAPPRNVGNAPTGE